MQRTITSISYCIELTNDQFTILEERDDLEISDPLYKQLSTLGCDNVEYNGHFGPNVFFTLGDAGHGEILSRVEKTITDYLL